MSTAPPDGPSRGIFVFHWNLEGIYGDPSINWAPQWDHVIQMTQPGTINKMTVAFENGPTYTKEFNVPPNPSLSIDTFQPVDIIGGRFIAPNKFQPEINSSITQLVCQTNGETSPATIRLYVTYEDQ